jgi:hypothetical protein
MQRKGRVFIGAWVRESLATLIDEAVHVSRVDRSTFLRQALAEKLEREGT